MKDKPFHLFLFGIFPPLILFVNNISTISAEQLILPIGIILGIIIVFFLILKPFIKNSLKIGLIISLGLVLFFSYGHAYMLLEDVEIINDLKTKHILLVIPFLLLFIFGTRYFLKTKRKLDNATKIVNAIAISLIIISVVNIADYSLRNTYSLEEISENYKSDFSKLKESPDMYLIILDGYAGKEILEKVYGYDNSKFLKFLDDKGFFIQENGFSNYSTTMSSLSSITNMEYVNYFSEQIGIDKQHESIPLKKISNSKVVDFFNSMGYVTVNYDSGEGAFRNINNADLNFCGKNTFLDSQLIALLLRTSMLNIFYVGLFEDDHRERILCAVEGIPQISKQFEEPTFVMSHMRLPHPPYIFGPNGEHVSPESLESGLSNWDDLDAYLNQVKFSNKIVSEIVEKILDSETPSVIIILSDHGTGYKLNYQNDSSLFEMNQRLQNINFIYFPEEDNVPIYDTITPVNIFRLIFNYYFEAEFELLEDRIFFSKYYTPYNYTEVTELLKTP